jgi:DNA mismatch endonuclease, patch repair protein
MDRLTKERRSWNMSRIKGRDTKPEKLVRSLLHRLGYRFRVHRQDLPGRPDIILPKYTTVIFVHGCFWHRHRGCKYAYIPKSRQDFWESKFRQNVERDSRKELQIKKMGWNVILVWECQLRDIKKLTDRLNKQLKGPLAAYNKMDCGSHAETVRIG